MLLRIFIGTSDHFSLYEFWVSSICGCMVVTSSESSSPRSALFPSLTNPVNWGRGRAGTGDPAGTAGTETNFGELTVTGATWGGRGGPWTTGTGLKGRGLAGI